MEEQVKQIMADILGLDPLSIDGSTAMDNVESWDSLNHLNLCLALEQEFRISLEVSEMEAMITYDDILQVLGEKAPS